MHKNSIEVHSLQYVDKYIALVILDVEGGAWRDMELDNWSKLMQHVWNSCKSMT
jgi:hypothetical protein